jgi:hypothetical protein
VKLKSVLGAVLMIVTVVGVVTLRVVVGCELEIAESSRALVGGNVRDATVHARAAALWYAPGAPHVRVAYERLMALGKAAEEHHDAKAALFAYNAVMGASSSTRWLVAPHRADALKAAEAIARIESTEPRPPAEALEPAPEIEKKELAALSRETGPRPEWIVALAASFVALVAGLAWVVFRGFDGAGRFLGRQAAGGLVLGVAGALVWIASMYVA